MSVAKFFEHKAVLLLLGFGLTTVTGGFLSSRWKRLEWENQQDYLYEERDLERRADLIDQLTKAAAETNVAAEDVLALYAYPSWKREQIQERKDNWRTTSRNWRITSKVLAEKLPVYFSNAEVMSTFDAIVKKRAELGNIVVNLPEPNSKVDSEGDRKSAQSLINEIKSLLRQCGSLMAAEVRHSSFRSNGYLVYRFGYPSSWWKSLLLNAAGSVAALIVFYGFYMWCSSRSSRNKASAELWWLPAWQCFRLVIRNIPAGFEITDIHSRAWLRDLVRRRKGSSVNSFRDTDLVRSDRVMLSREDDYPLICFKLKKVENCLHFIRTDKFGAEEKSHVLAEEFEEFLVEYSAKIQTWWLIKYEINRTYVVPKLHEADGKLLETLLATQEANEEEQFPYIYLRAHVVRVSI